MSLHIPQDQYIFQMLTCLQISLSNDLKHKRLFSEGGWILVHFCINLTELERHLQLKKRSENFLAVCS